MGTAEFAHRFSRHWLTSLPHAVLVFFAAFLFGATGDWWLLPMGASPAVAALLVMRLSRPRPVVVPVVPPCLELKAPNPAPGQCPVCSLEDLDERAVGDELLGDGGTALARVVAYGPHRAHAECAAVVPYVPPARSTSGGSGYRATVIQPYTPPIRGRGFTYDEPCAKVPLQDGRALCLVHNEGDPKCSVYPRKGTPGRAARWLQPAIEAEAEKILRDLRRFESPDNR